MIGPRRRWRTLRPSSKALSVRYGKIMLTLRGRIMLLAVSVSLMAVFSSTAQSAPQPVKEADVFVDSIGTNMHLGWYDTVYYSKWTGVRDKLVASGIRHVRDEAKHASGNATDGSDAGFYSHLRELNSYGIKANLSVGPAYAGL